MDNSFEKDLALDINALHLEWQEQAKLYGKWAKRLSKAVKARFKLEELLKVVRIQTKRDVDEVKAELDGLIREDFVSLGFEKRPTEAAITNWILIQPKVKEVQDNCFAKVKRITDDLADAMEQEELFQGACLAMSHKKSAIEGEVKLWLGEYFSDPDIPKDIKVNIQKETQERIRSRGDKKKPPKKKLSKSHVYW